MSDHDDGLYRRKDTKYWWMEYYATDEHGRAKKIQKTTRQTSKTKARKVRNAAVSAVEQGNNPHIAKNVRFADLARRLLADYRIRGRKSTDRAELALSHLRDTFGGWKAVNITANAIDTYLLDRTETAALATVQYELAMLKRAFRLAAKKGDVGSVPIFPEMEMLNNARTGFFSDADLVALQVELPEYLRGLAEFAYLTSWRKREMLDLTWSRVDMEQCLVWLDARMTKSGKARTFPFKSYPALQAVLESQREYSELWEDRTGKIVTHVFTNRGKSIKDYYAAWRAACKRAGLEGRMMHDMRRSAVRNMIRAGIPQDIAMKLSGHETDSIFSRYNIVNEEDLNDATAKLGRRGYVSGTEEPKSGVKSDWGEGA